MAFTRSAVRSRSAPPIKNIPGWAFKGFILFNPCFFLAFFFAGVLFFRGNALKEKQNNQLYSFKKQELALKVTKEIVIKFIEIGRVTPTSFSETFRLVYSEVSQAISPKNKD